MSFYVGILDGSGKTFGLRIPDLEGCYGAGSSAEHALADGISAAREWIAHRMTTGQKVPKPRKVSSVLAEEPLNAEAGEVVVLVPVVLDKGRTVRANVTFEAGLLEAIDDEASKRGLTRSAFLASAARDRLGGA